LSKKLDRNEERLFKLEAKNKNLLVRIKSLMKNATKHNDTVAKSNGVNLGKIIELLTHNEKLNGPNSTLKRNCFLVIK